MRSEITIRDVVQSGRTLALGVRGRWFKSSHLDKRKGQYEEKNKNRKMVG